MFPRARESMLEVCLPSQSTSVPRLIFGNRKLKFILKILCLRLGNPRRKKHPNKDPSVKQFPRAGVTLQMLSLTRQSKSCF